MVFLSSLQLIVLLNQFGVDEHFWLLSHNGTGLKCEDSMVVFKLIDLSPFFVIPFVFRFENCFLVHKDDYHDSNIIFSKS
jgi:hypothetical protein